PVLVGGGLAQLGAGDADLGAVEGIVDLGQDGPFLDARFVVDDLVAVVQVAAKMNDLTDHLGANVHDVLRFQGAGGADGGQEVAAHHGFGVVAVGGVAVGPAPKRPATRGENGENKEEKEASLDKGGKIGRRTHGGLKGGGGEKRANPGVRVDAMRREGCRARKNSAVSGWM